MAELNFGAGDRVKLRLALEEREGTIIESADNSVVLLKLDSGYNIGIPKENILGSKIVKKYKEEEREEGEKNNDTGAGGEGQERGIFTII